MPSTQLFPLRHGTIVTTDNAGQFGVLGDAGHGNTGGALLVEIIPDVSFAGSFSVQGRSGGGPLSKQDNTTPVPFLPIPYRGINLNGVVSDYSFRADLITGPSLLHVPASGLTIALLIACTAGTATVFVRTLEGAGSP